MHLHRRQVNVHRDCCHAVLANDAVAGSARAINRLHSMLIAVALHCVDSSLPAARHSVLIKSLDAHDW